MKLIKAFSFSEDNPDFALELIKFYLYWSVHRVESAQRDILFSVFMYY